MHKCPQTLRAQLVPISCLSSSTWKHTEILGHPHTLVHPPGSTDSRLGLGRDTSEAANHGNMGLLGEHSEAPEGEGGWVPAAGQEPKATASWLISAEPPNWQKLRVHQFSSWELWILLAKGADDHPSFRKPHSQPPGKLTGAALQALSSWVRLRGSSTFLETGMEGGAHKIHGKVT